MPRNPYESPREAGTPHPADPEWWRWFYDRVALIVCAAITFICVMVFGFFYAWFNGAFVGR